MTPRAPDVIHTVPKAWQSNPAGWWRHVAICPVCSKRYAP